ncbi:MAG TPA: HD domain-containing phosphohydrolase [Propionibacteriaceae bacterium]|nr:HD domain-containing phosphohydrolase [Propionibacteriaceae bacterium]
MRIGGVEASGVRVTEFLAALSFGADLGLGHPTEHVLRQTYIALHLAERLAMGDREREVVYYSSLLAWLGCHIDAYEQAKWFGDDQAFKHDAAYVDAADALGSVAFLLRHIGDGRPLAERVKAGVGFLADGRHDLEQMYENHWRAACAFSEDLGLSDAVRDSVAQTFERWDGKGEPDGIKGEQVLASARLVHLADVAAVFHHTGGVQAAVEVARARSGGQFDPALVKLFETEADVIFAELEQVTTWDAVMSKAPTASRELSEGELDRVLAAAADFVDLKSPYTLGHSRGVADLAAAASAEFGANTRTVCRAGLVHDLGRMGVANTIWDKRAPLTAGEVERVRLHPYYTDRILASVPALAPLAPVASQHHERLDGSGYPRGTTAESLTPEGRLLAVADCYQAWSEPRPYRDALDASAVAARLRDEVRAGRLDGAAVDAVLRAAGHRVRRNREWPAGLTAREVEVLRHLARGMSQQQIAERLVISRKTAGNHVEHIYAKIGVSNRAMASLFATRHGLL